MCVNMCMDLGIGVGMDTDSDTDMERIQSSGVDQTESFECCLESCMLEAWRIPRGLSVYRGRAIVVPLSSRGNR